MIFRHFSGNALLIFHWLSLLVLKPRLLSAYQRCITYHAAKEPQPVHRVIPECSNSVTNFLKSPVNQCSKVCSNLMLGTAAAEEISAKCHREQIQPPLVGG